MLNHLSWPTLEQRRKCIKLVMFFKIVHHLVEIGSSMSINALHTVTRGHHSRYVLATIMQN